MDEIRLFKNKCRDKIRIVEKKWSEEIWNQYGQREVVILEATAEYRDNYTSISRLKRIRKLLDKYLVPTVTILNHNPLKYENDNECIIAKPNPPDEEILGWYRTAKLLLILPGYDEMDSLVKAAIFGIPVIATQGSRYTSIAAQIGLVVKDSIPSVAAAVLLLLTNRSLYRLFAKQAMTIAGVTPGLNTPWLQVEGPFDSSYSLSIVNRQFALAFSQLKKDTKVSLLPVNGWAGLEDPDPEWLDTQQTLKRLYKNGKTSLRPLVSARFCYPPRVCEMRGLYAILHGYGWEESEFPWEFVEQFNRCLDGIAVLSNYVKRVLRQNGVTVPIKVTGAGANHILDISPRPLDDDIGAGFRFLHVSSCFPRKGPDILVEAYCKAFSAEDDVTLIIKTFPNPHNKIDTIVANARKRYPRCPKICIINREIDEEQLLWLMQKSNCLVLPSRGEGLGLPAAEAMFLGIPVITTGYGGQTDFCNPKTAWLIDYSFAPATTHMQLPGSVWVEPDVDHLSSIMKAFPTLPLEEIEKKTKSANSLVQSHYTWERCTSSVSSFIKKIKEKDDLKKAFASTKQWVGWISTWNCRCGIAEYSRMLLKFLGHEINLFLFAPHDQHIERPDEPWVQRCWCRHGSLQDLYDAIIKSGVNSIVFQFHFAFFDLDSLAFLIEKLKAQGKKIYLVMHAVEDPIPGISISTISSSLALVDQILCHHVHDLNTLKEWGLIKNVCLFPHGVPDFHPENVSEPNRVAYFGFLLPHKGIEQLIEAFSTLIDAGMDIRLTILSSIYPAIPSWDCYHRVRAKLCELGIRDCVDWYTDYLSEKDCLNILSKARLIVLPYQHTKESSSAAVRMALAARRPVLCTPLSIFDDVREIVHFSRSTTPEDIASAMKNLLTDNELLQSKMDRQISWIESRTWNRIAKRFSGLLKGDMKDNSL